MDLPTDPYILLGYVNTKLRDCYADLESLCRGLDLDRDALVAKLAAAGFEYVPALNQFR